MRVRTVDDIGSFTDLKEPWNRLVAACPGTRPFLTHEWLDAWWRSFGAGHRLAILLCEDDGGLAGALPLYHGIGRFLPLRTLRLMGDEGPGAVGLGPFALPGAQAEVAEQLAAHLRSRGDWETLCFRGCDEGVAAIERAIVGGGGGFSAVQADGSASPQIALPSSWEAYRAGLSKHRRWDISRARRKAEELGVSLETVSSADELPGACDDLVRLLESRMRHVIGPRFHIDRPTDRFLHLILPSLLAQGRLRLTFLVADGRRIAAEFQVRHEDTMYALIGGFEQEYASFEVSKALFGMAVESAIAEGCTLLDFGAGVQEYKLRWGVTNLKRFVDLRVYAPTARGRLKQSVDVAQARARQFVGKAGA
jgi:CelD/BcsL family acetyltransferase involved in cellulose biosynthesis